MRLARVGIETVKGFLDGGMYAWDKAGMPTATVAQLALDELHSRLEEGSDLQIVDVRRPAEYQSGHVPRAENVPLSQLEQQRTRLEPTRATAVVCASGYRSSIATSILERKGFRGLFNVVGGTNGWIQAGYPVEEEKG